MAILQQPAAFIAGGEGFGTLILAGNRDGDMPGVRILACQNCPGVKSVRMGDNNFL
jgi:hypothetical protein